MSKQVVDSTETNNCPFCGKILSNKKKKICNKCKIKIRKENYKLYYQGKKKERILDILSNLEEKHRVEVDNEFIAETFSKISASQFSVESLIETAFYMYAKSNCNSSAVISSNDFENMTKNTKLFVKEIFDDIGLNSCRIENEILTLIKKFDKEYDEFTSADVSKIEKNLSELKNANLFSGKKKESIVGGLVFYFSENKIKKSVICEFFGVTRPSITTMEKELDDYFKKMELTEMVKSIDQAV